MQADRRSDVPLILDICALLIQVHDAAGGQFMQGRFPRFGKNIAAGHTVGDMAGMVIRGSIRLYHSTTVCNGDKYSLHRGGKQVPKSLLVYHQPQS